MACGSGRFSIPISKKGIEVVAVDYDLVPLRKLKDKRRGKSIMLIRGDANKLPFKKSCFDCIIAIEIVGYLDVMEFFKECNKALRKDGFFLFTTSNKHSYKRCIHRILSSYSVFYRHSFDEITAYLEEGGFELMECQGFNWVPFNRDSNSILLGFFEFLEKMLRLVSFSAISPMVFFIAKKKEAVE